MKETKITAKSGIRVKQLYQNMKSCTICPRLCKTARTEGQLGYCRIGKLPRISSFGPHFGEESILVGPGGSGTIFLTGCNLRCVYCQNYDISFDLQGREISIPRLAEIMIELQNRNCSNINFVSPSHLPAQIVAAILLARKKGLSIPIIYNTGGYDSIETLKLLQDLIDIYMPDMKYSDSLTSQKYSDAPDYPAVNRAAVKEMHRQVGDLELKKGKAVKGLLIRHLFLPNELADALETIDFIAEKICINTYLNILGQYHPAHHARDFPELNQTPDPTELKQARDYAKKLGLNLL